MGFLQGLKAAFAAPEVIVIPPTFAPGVSHTQYRKDREAETGWWRLRELVWPVGGHASFQAPRRFGKSPRYSPEELRKKISGPPAYGFTYWQYHNDPKFGWEPRTEGEGDPDTLELDFGEAVSARALHLYLPGGNGAGLGGVVELTLIGPDERETVIFEQPIDENRRDGGGPALHIFDFAAPRRVLRVRMKAVSYVRRVKVVGRPGHRAVLASAVVDTVGLVAESPRPGTPASVDHRPKSRPEIAWFWKFMLLAAVLAMAWSGVELLMRPAPSGVPVEVSASAMKAQGAPVAGPADAPTATTLPREAWPALKSPTTRWATRVYLNESTGDGWTPISELTELKGSPDDGVFALAIPDGKIQGLVVEFAASETPVREVAIVGSTPANAVIGVILEDPQGEELITWRATRPLADTTGDTLRVSFSSPVHAARVTIILRQRGAATLSGIALVE